MTYPLRTFLGAMAIALSLVSTAVATYPPFPGMLEQMERDGTLEQSKQFAFELGNHELKMPNRGALVLDDYQAVDIAQLILDNFGRSLDAKTSSQISRSTSQELSWVELDLNHDRIVDERDLLALGHPRPKSASILPSMGDTNFFTLIIEFPDYAGYFSAEHMDDMVFGDGQAGTWYRGLNYYYDQASYGQLNIQGSVYGWHTAENSRDYYHPNDDDSYPGQTARRQELIWEAITAADDAGEDFSIYDNDGDGVIDEFCVVWTGPHGAWSTFWWGYHTGWSGSQYIDGVRLGNYSWQWERSYGFSQSPPTPSHWSTTVLIHETGHGLGLPDWYDYDGNQGPDGGVGGLDIMHGNSDHSCYNKFLLGWINPLVAYTNLDDEQFDFSGDYRDALIFMPGFDPVTPWAEYFMAQNRKDSGIDSPLPGEGMLLWHVDARVNERGSSLYNNSYTDHKHLRVMEADGLEEIETGNGRGDAGDFYDGPDTLTPATTPNTNDYAGNDTGISVDDISAIADAMTADFTLFSGTPPSVSIDSPNADDTVGGTTAITITASDDTSVAKVQVLLDGMLAHEWTSWDGEETYQWNTRCELNADVVITARAWDGNNQAASDTITVTASNTGVVETEDDFEAGLFKWKVMNFPLTKRGTYTQWDLRTSPGSPTPLGSGQEAYVDPLGADANWHNAQDYLRSQRLDLSGYTRAMHVTFYYRCRSGLALFSSTDNGATWDELDSLASTNSWKTYNRIFDLGTGHAYLELRYTGDLRQNTNGAQGANIDEFYAREAASDPPTVTITSHTDGDTVSGNTTFQVSATDDSSVSEVEFFLNGSSRLVDTASPWEYTRNTVNDDNHPGIELVVYAEDDDGIRSEPDSMTLVWYNDRPFPLFDDLESDDDDWSYQNDGDQPSWVRSETDSSSGDWSMAWTGTIETDNTDGLWYWGYPPTSGRQCVNLAHPDVLDPVVTFMLNGDAPTSMNSGLYLYTTWSNWQWITGWYQDTDGWEEIEISLDNYIGYSGRLVWYMWSGTDTTGTGIWIDDVNVHNISPVISSISPDRGVIGASLTITGIGFQDTQGASTLTFYNGVDAGAGDITSWSDTEIEVNIPTGAESGAVFVVVDGEQSNNSDVAVVLDAPSLDDLQRR